VKRGLWRASVFLSAVWLALIAVTCILTPGFDWRDWVLYGVLPVGVIFGIPWGVVWVFEGFRRG